MRGNESWVTYVSNNHEGIKALILGRSLRRSLTTRGLTVFVSSNVSEEICEHLEAEFDRCITIRKKQLERYHGLSVATLAKLQCWKLNKLDKFAFLDCNALMLRNSDELFGQTGCVTVTAGQFPTTSLIVDCPSTERFNELLATAKNGDFLFPDNCLDEKYCVPVDVEATTFQRNIPETNIVYFTGRHPLEIVSTLTEKNHHPKVEGLMEKVMFKFWTKLIASGNPNFLETAAEILQVKPAVIQNGTKIPKPIPNDFSTLSPLDPLANSIAIVGMGMRFPGANNLDEFWELLISGRDGIVKVPPFRWTEDQCFNRPENTMDTQAGFLKCPIDQIDSKFFGLSPLEVSFMDPQQRLTLQVMWEAFEHAGINPLALKNSKTGVFGGWWRNDYKEMLQEGGIQESEFFRSYMGNTLGTLTGRISHVLELTGPSISTESGCSTSIVAVDMACKSLQNGDCDLGLAFGVNLLLHPFSVSALSSIVAVDGHCKTFDAKADGFGRAEGCAVLVLKRFPDAVRDGDRVFGLIRGSAVVQEGPSRSLGTPTKQCEALAMKLALQDARVQAKDISFVETHGTGTPVGDPLEVAAVSEVYSKGRQNKLIIGSVKTNIGHTESCSGIAGIIKTILSLQNEVIPPHQNFDTLNPEIHLETIPAEIPLTPSKWPKDPNGKPRIAGVSSFGITGTDAHVIIQETPELPKPALAIPSEMPTSILKLSAKSPEALQDLITSYKAVLENTNEDLTDIAYTTNIGRGDFPFRSAILGSTKSEMLQAIEKKSFEIKQIPGDVAKTCFLFTGQGSQYPGMAKKLYEASPIFRINFDECAKVLLADLDICIKSALWGDKTGDLSRTIYSQTSIFCVEYCLLKLWESWGVKPDVVLGHSLGEFGAAVAAGILSFKDALKLVAKRSDLIDQLPQGQMVVVKESREKVEIMLKQAFSQNGRWLDFAAINSPEQTVLAGTEENVGEFVKFCGNNQIKALILQATHAFHSRLMDPMLEEYREFASKIKYNDPTCTYVSGMEGKVVEKVDADYWVRHTREPVRFISASESVLETGASLFLEVGPQPVLSTMILINSDSVPTQSPPACFPSLRKGQEEWPTILGTLGKLYLQGLNVNWKNFHQFSTGKKITLPYYPFQNKTQWFDMKGEREKKIHPLVGTPVPNPSPLKLFQSSVDLGVTFYLKDHVIGNTIVFPGAGFLEMCLVSGHAAYQDLDGGYMPPLAPVTLEDFVIEGPLALSETERTQMQVVVSTEDGADTRVTVYSKLNLDKETFKWIRHASGKFSPYAVQCDVEDKVKADSLEQIKARCPSPDPDFDVTRVYQSTTKAGLRFGPTFRTLKAGWDGIDKEEAYFEINGSGLNLGPYISHPVIIDAMFQAICVALNPENDTLQVPVSLTKFVWYAKMETETGYVHCFEDKRTTVKEYIATLYDSNGQRIALMVGATLLETTVTTVLAAIEAQRTALPSFYEEVWKPQLGHLEKRIPIMSKFNTVFSSDYKAKFLPYNSLDSAGQTYYEKSNRLCLYYMLHAFYKLGWTAEAGSTFTLPEFLTSLKILPTFERFVFYMLNELFEEGLVHRAPRGLYKVPNSLPSKAEVASGIESLYKELDPETNKEIACGSATGALLAEILSGKQLPLPILFPEDEANAKVCPAEDFYNTSELRRTNFAIVNEVFPALLEDLTRQAEEEKGKGILRVLEVGAGTGSFTKIMLPSLSNHSSEVEFTYSDISPAFFAKGQQVFENCKNIKVLYKTLNIEEDPMSQGFIPEQYDLIQAGFVIHATENVRKTLAYLHSLLRPGGCLVMMELTKPLRIVNLIFGVLEGFWKFSDTDLRPHNCEMRSGPWETVLKETGYCDAISFDGYLDHSSVICARAAESSPRILPTLSPDSAKNWLLFGKNDAASNIILQKLKNMGRNVVLVHKSMGTDLQKINPNLWNIRTSEESDMTAVMDELAGNSSAKKKLEGIVYLWGLDHEEAKYDMICQPFLALCKILVRLDQTKLLLVTRGAISQGDHDVTLPFTSPLWGMTKALQNENSNIQCKCVDLDPSLPIAVTVQEGFAELFIDDSELNVVYRGHQRIIPRFLPFKLPNSTLNFPKSERFRLVLPSSNAISDLRFGIAEKPILGRMDVEVQVRAYSLNFRDVFAVLKPDSQFDNLNTVGIDYAGVVSNVGPGVTLHKVGDSVFGINLNGDALPSHIIAPEDLLIPLRPDMTFCDAATIPAVAATAYLSLLTVANLKKGETVLIHTGSGGVGLCAIQIAQSLGCNIITTAGSARKRAYLRNLGIQHVFHSRNTNYEQDIKQALGGAMVDVVLNSITGPGFKEASLSVCKEGARFIEMSKLNTWTKEEVQSLRPDVFYEIVDLSAASEAKIKEYMGQVKGLIDTAFIKPIPYVRFDAGDIREALGFMQKAKHIGKVVCVMPEPASSRGAGELQTPLFNSRSTYLITGGLGGIGMEVAKWMADSGARNLALVGRKCPSDKVSEEIRKLRAKGVNTVVMQCDVGDFDQCQNLVQSLKQNPDLPPLRGIMHSAGVLSDASFDNQTWPKYLTTFNPKVNGGWNLHKLTLDCSLEHFVMFSSAVASLGALGQSNHCAANTFLDSFTHYRNSIGLPATTVNWGLWSQVGVAANLDVIGLKPITPFQGISALERVMKGQLHQICVIEANFSVIRKAFPGMKRYLEELKDGQAENMEVLQVSSEDFWREYEEAEEGEKNLVVNKFLRSVIRQVLKMDEADVIDDNANLQDIGMDSLMMIEMKNVLQSLVGSRAKITVNSVKDCHTVAELGNRVVELVSGVEMSAPLTREELAKLIAEDSELAPGIVPPTPVGVKASEIGTVLVTGATGNLGPYILKELCKRSHIQKIYCLLRGSKKATPTDRLKKLLEEKNLLQEVNLELIECLPGNVIQDRFGLSQEVYDKLTGEVDCVFHLAIKSNWQVLYHKSRPADNDIRTVNVLGTKKVLEFASATKTKYIYHPSGTVAATTLDPEGHLSEDWPGASDFDKLPNDAYPISKYICDRLMSQAVERGFPVKVFRFPFIGGDSQTGSNVSALNNALMLQMMAYMHLGAMPAYPVPFIIVPVDACASLSTRIFFNDEAGFEIYNVSNPEVNDEQELEDFAGEFGHPVETIEPDDFMEFVEKQPDSELLVFVKKFAENRETRDRLQEDMPEPLEAWMTRRGNVFYSKKLEKFIPEYPQCMETSLAVLKRDLKFAKESGVFAKVGLS